MIQALLKKIGVLGSAFLLIISLTVLPLTPVFTVEKAEAQWLTVDIPVGVTTALSAIQNTLTAVATAASEAYQWYMNQKESVLDGIAFTAINMILQQMSDSIVTWINSGFEGSPSFVTNFDQFLLDIGDKLAGDFIFNGPLNFLCSPFKVDIQFALDIQYGKSKKDQFSCSLTGIGDNIESFFNGDFLAGGWDGWFKVTSTPVNNPYGALLEAQSALSLTISAGKDSQVKTLDFGKGFLSSKKCKEVDDESGGHSVCETVTPGTAIESQLNATLDSGRQRIQVADEINEIVGALFAQLAVKAFSSGGNGVAGLTERDGDGRTYFDDIDDDPTDDNPNLNSGNAIVEAIGLETDYVGLHQEMEGMIDDIESYKSDTYGEDDSCHTGLLPASLENKRQKTVATIETSLQTIGILVSLNEEMLATTSPQGKMNVMQGFSSLQQSGALHRGTEIERVRLTDLDTLQKDIVKFKDEVDQRCIVIDTGGGGGP